MSAASHGVPGTPGPDAAERTRRTYRWDLLRGVAVGITEPTWNTFGLLIAIQVFAAGETAKALVAGATNIGMLLTPLSLVLFSRIGLRGGPAAAACLVATGLLLLVATFATSATVFVAAFLAAALCGTQQIPLLVSIYSANYSSSERGWRFSRTALVSASVGIAFSTWAGHWLDADLGFWRALLAVTATATVLSAIAFARMPSGRVGGDQGHGLLDGLRFVRSDPVFARLLAAWMLMGLGNLMTLPIRVDYLVDSTHGVGATNAQAAMILVAVPALFRLMFTRFWGRLFDRVNFITLRTVMNLFSLLAIALFFSSTWIPLLVVASACHGIALGGGNIAWQLWVTKIAPPDRVSSYMSVHSASTGIRGAAAPFIAYALLAHLPPVGVALVGATLLALSFLVFLPAKAALEPEALASRGHAAR